MVKERFFDIIIANIINAIIKNYILIILRINKGIGIQWIESIW